MTSQGMEMKGIGLGHCLGLGHGLGLSQGNKMEGKEMQGNEMVRQGKTWKSKA
jgi:hypothetical protein